MEENKGLNISTKSFITATLVIFVLMVCTYLLTFVIPGGEYARVIDEAGNTIIDTAKGFQYVDGGISFVTWALSPILVLFGEGSGSIIAVICAPILMYLFHQPIAYVVYCALGAIYIIYLHRENVKRLINGEENKVR